MEVMVTTIGAYRPVAACDAHILMVEDNTGNYVTEARLVTSSGVMPWNMEWRVSGWGVLEYASTLGPLDLILLDIGLPHEDGYEVLKKIRATEQFNRTLVVAVSGLTDEMEKAKASGFDSFIGKPLDADRFPGQLLRILKGEQVWENQ